MSDQTKIAWTNRTWNPWRGCTKIDPGCRNCYMFTAQRRYGRDPTVVTRTQTWRDPLKWNRQAERTGRRDLVFTCSWSDWFHKDADQWREEAWEVVHSCRNLTFQILTKRADRIADHLPRDWGDGYPNIWLGVSVSDETGLWRIDELRAVKSFVRFLSYEPMLGPLTGINLEGIHWFISGGESGPAYRAPEGWLNWARQMRDDCRSNQVPFFWKQSPGPRPGMRDTLDGMHHRELPA